MHIFFVGPVGSDLRFRKKQEILSKVAARHECTVFLPLNTSSERGLGDVIPAITAAEFVLVDLSFERPSCYYEMGVAEALGARVQTIAEAQTHIHQTENPSSVIFYTTLEDFEFVITDICNRRLRSLTKTQKRTDV